MTDLRLTPCTAFQGFSVLHAGPCLEVALAVKRATEADFETPVLVFDDANGRVIDLDLRGTERDVADRLAAASAGRRASSRILEDPPATRAAGPKGRGRPKLGVVAREVTLLPRHWDWLSAQRGGASATLRRLVDEARRQPDTAARERAAREASYNFMQAVAGDLPGYEEATRALFAGDRPGMDRLVADWPRDVGEYALRLAFGEGTGAPA